MLLLAYIVLYALAAVVLVPVVVLSVECVAALLPARRRGAAVKVSRPLSPC